jgi:hypothetical protein
LALEALRETAESFAGTVKLEPLVKTYAGTRALLAIGTHPMRQEASHALPLLGPHAGPLKAALADREAFLREMRRREGRLRGRYRASIYEMNLEDLLASWVDAQSANFFRETANCGACVFKSPSIQKARFRMTSGQRSQLLLRLQNCKGLAARLMQRLSLMESLGRTLRRLQLTSIGRWSGRDMRFSLRNSSGRCSWVPRE